MVAAPRQTNPHSSLTRPVFGGVAGSDPAVVQAIGNTPLLGLSRFAQRIGLPPSIELWLKAEWANPGGSVKDRPALAIVRHGLAVGTARRRPDTARCHLREYRHRLCHAGRGVRFPGRARHSGKRLQRAQGDPDRLWRDHRLQRSVRRFQRRDPAGARAGGRAAASTTSMPINTAMPPIRARITRPLVPKSGNRPMAASPISWPGSAPPAR